MKSNKMIAAVFDVDGTLIERSMERIFLGFLWNRGELGFKNLFNLLQGAMESILAGQSPVLANKAWLRGKHDLTLRRLARDCFETEIRPKLLPAAVERLRWHQDSGHYLILISGSLDMLLEPLAEFLGIRAWFGTKLETHDESRMLTGRIAGLHPCGKSKERCLLDINHAGAFDLRRSFAYADRYSDRFLLSSVGNPVAANAEAGLRRFAEKHDWLIEDFVNPERSLTEGAYGRI
ncbi:MAG: HAD-IB family hydrolase [Acidobacteria bacterium]|nr:HAD-IB family hydrolase [Acidobacteriota bacterium]